MTTMTTMPATSAALPFLRDSEMAERLRAFDWSTTPLGPIERWPPSLRAAVGICMNSRFPMFVWWGPELINIYNDAYIPVLGKRHPTALGRGAREIWSDIWPVIGADVMGVVERGEPVYKERVRLVMERNGYSEETYFTYSHSPIPDDEGGIGGLFQVCSDETSAVMAERARDREADHRRAADERAAQILESITDGFFSVDRSWHFTYVNRQAEGLLERAPDDLLGRDLWASYPGLRGSEFERAYRRTMDEGVASSAMAFYPDHRRWYEVQAYPSPDGISVYFRDVSERQQAEQERMNLLAEVARQARVFDTTLSSISDFAYTFDRQGRFIYVNKALLDLLGMRLEEVVGKDFFDLPYPRELAARLMRQIRQVVETAERVSDEAQYTSPTGAGGYYEYIFSPVLAADGTVEAVAGSTRDITERKRLEFDRERLLQSLQAERKNLAAIIEHAPAFICTLSGPEHVFELYNQNYHELVGKRKIAGEPVRKALPEIEGQGFFELLDHVYRTGESHVSNEASVRLRRDDGSFDERIISFVYQALRQADGSISGIFVHGVDITHSVRAREALRISEERERRAAADARAAAEANAKFRTFFDQGTNFAGLMTTDGTVIEANRLSLDACGFTGDEVIGKKFWECGWWSPDPQLADIVRAGTQLAAAGETYRKETAYFVADGSQRQVDLTIAPVVDEAGRVLFIAPTGVDITDKKRYEDEREQMLAHERFARAEAERVGRMKDEFLATLSHELRTPLNAMLGWAQVLGNENVEPRVVKKGLEAIERNARSQAQLIEDLLDMSRIVSGKVRLDVQPVDLAAVVDAALDVVRPAAHAKGIQLERTLDPGAPSIFADANRLQQVLWNLLTNAIKFTAKGGRVQVVLQPLDAGVELRVSDTGEGIDPRFLPHVFDRFSQADPTTTRHYGGLGLGLSIVKSLVEMHGGYIRAESDGLGCGATFIIRLPMTAAQRLAAELPSRRSESDPIAGEVGRLSLTGKRVLVVDDEADARMLVRYILETRGASVVTAQSAREALRLVEQEKPGLIVSDIGMPEMDGYAFIRELRSRPSDRGGRIPAVALTAFARSEERQRALQAGYEFHVPKPVDAGELVSVCAQLLDVPVSVRSDAR